MAGNKTGTTGAKQNRLSIDIQLLSRFTRTLNRSVLEPIFRGFG